jgi:hypothetical protein
VAQGHLPDPVLGLANLHVPEALSRHAWWYRRAFRLPAELDTGPGRRLRLDFDGVNHHAEVWLNGRQVGELAEPFSRASFDATDALLRADHEQAPGDAELAVTLHNTGDVTASMVGVSLRDARTGERVLPVRCSDNYLWLLPGASREVTVSWPTREPPSERAAARPQVVVEAYNAPPPDHLTTPPLPARQT